MKKGLPRFWRYRGRNTVESLCVSPKGGLRGALREPPGVFLTHGSVKMQQLGSGIKATLDVLRHTISEKRQKTRSSGFHMEGMTSDQICDPEWPSTGKASRVKVSSSRTGVISVTTGLHLQESHKNQNN